MNLFANIEAKNAAANEPLASRMRPRTLDEIIGQDHILGEDKLLRRLVTAQRLSSIILYGPPGTGKTSLARILARETAGDFRALSAVSASVKDVREILAWANDKVAATGKRPILFLDEIHRFNRSQQDALLPDVEAGIITLIGATTSNPFFSVNDALLSRSQIFELHSLTPIDIQRVVEIALNDNQRGFGDRKLKLDGAAMRYLSEIVDGDARRALGALEIAVLSTPANQTRLNLDAIVESVQQKTIRFDPTGNEHYDLASAFIKSIRGSDVDASLYWLATALESGEDIRFLCRRLVILASEDIGNADPQALVIAVAAMQACEFVGLPECQLTLSQCVIYLALAPKSNSATTAISIARKEVREKATIPVPKHLRDGHYKGSKTFGHGVGYQYAHEHDQAVAAQDYLGVEREYYAPSDRGFELELSQRLAKLRRLLSGESEAT